MGVRMADDRPGGRLAGEAPGEWVTMSEAIRMALEKLRIEPTLKDKRRRRQGFDPLPAVGGAEGRRATGGTEDGRQRGPIPAAGRYRRETDARGERGGNLVRRR